MFSIWTVSENRSGQGIAQRADPGPRLQRDQSVGDQGGEKATGGGG